MATTSVATTMTTTHDIPFPVRGEEDPEMTSAFEAETTSTLTSLVGFATTGPMTSSSATQTPSRREERKDNEDNEVNVETNTSRPTTPPVNEDEKATPSATKLRPILSPVSSSLQLTSVTLQHPIALIIDIGSSSTRCSAYYILESGAVKGVDKCSGEYAFKVTQDNTKCKLDSICDAVDATIDGCIMRLRIMRVARNIVSVGFDSFVMNLVGVDEEGRWVGPLMTYGVNDEGTRREVEACKNILKGREKEYHQTTGTVIHESYLPGQLRNFAKSRPEEFGRVVKFTSIATAVLSRWCMTAYCPISFSEASWCGIFDFRKKGWSNEYVDLLLPKGSREKLPTIVDFSDDRVPRIESMDGVGAKNPYWKRWPELRAETCRLFLGVGDGAAANVGSRCGGEGRICVTIGTSAAVRVVVKGGEVGKFVVPKGLWCYRVDGDRLLVGGALTDGGSVVEWLRQLLGLEEDEDFEDIMKEVGEGRGDKGQGTVVPFFSGERSTGWRGNATSAMVGITKGAGKADFVRMNLEGISFRLAAIVDLLKSSIGGGMGKGKEILVASGTGLDKNRVWRQMISDSCGMDMAVLKEGEATSRGVAMLLSEALVFEVGGEGNAGSDIKLESLEGLEMHVARSEMTVEMKRKRANQEKVIHALEGAVWEGM